MSRTILVSNRSLAVAQESIQFDSGGGGLQKLVYESLNDDDVWISPASSEEVAIFSENPSQDHYLNGKLITIRKPIVGSVTREKHYKFSNEFWWPLLHLTYERLDNSLRGVFPSPRFNRSDYQAFDLENRIIAHDVLEEVGRDPTAPIVFHDFHFILAPQYVMEGLIHKQAPIGFFFHTPFFDPVITKDLERNQNTRNLLVLVCV